jgi:hypothetical protein
MAINSNPGEREYVIAGWLVQQVRRLGFPQVSLTPIQPDHFAAVQHLSCDRQLAALKWACGIQATAAEMKAYDRAVHGEDLSA